MRGQVCIDQRGFLQNMLLTLGNGEQMGDAYSGTRCVCACVCWVKHRNIFERNKETPQKFTLVVGPGGRECGEWNDLCSACTDVLMESFTPAHIHKSFE